MRPKGLIGLLVVILLVAGAAYLLSDRLIERQLESAGESIVGAKVEIDNLNFDLLGLAISLDRLQVTNPNDTWKNMFETGEMKFDMETAPLSRKKIIINNIKVADIRIGTQRQTNGYLPPKPKEPPGWVDHAIESLKQKVAAAPVLNLGMLKQKINVDSLMAFVNIQSLQRLETLKLSADSTRQRWQTIIAEFDPKGELKAVETQIHDLTSQEIKGVENLIAALDKSKKIYDTVNGFKKETEQKKALAALDIKQVKTAVASIDNWIADDIDAIKSKARLPDFSAQNIGTMLFGHNVIQPIVNMLPYIDLARKYMPAAQQFMSAGKVEKPPRFVGQNIRFLLRHPKPNFLIEEIFISGVTNQQDTSKVLYLSGKVNGVTSHPRVYGKPLSFQLAADLPNSTAYQLTGVVDHTGDIPAERFELKAAGIRLGNISLPARPYLPSQIDARRGDLATRFSLAGSQLDFEVGLTARPVSFIIPDSLIHDDLISKVTSSLFNSVDMLQLSARIYGTTSDLNLQIRSNIDNVLAERMKELVGESVKLARAEIEKRVNAIVEPKKQEALALVSKMENQITGGIQAIENDINKKLAVADEKKKEIEKKIKGETTKDVTKKLKGLIKN